ncbi:MAG: cell division protein FtsL [Terriglobia bacterium]
MATAPVVVPDSGKRLRAPAVRLAGHARYPDVYFHKAVDNSHLVREPDPAERRQFVRLLGACACIFLVIFGIALLHFECQHYGYEISQLKSESAQLRESNQKLQLEQALLTDPQRIDQLARQDLGLRPTQPQQVVRLGGAEPGLQPGPQPDGAPVMARNFNTLTPSPRGSSREP